MPVSELMEDGPESAAHNPSDAGLPATVLAITASPLPVEHAFATPMTWNDSPGESQLLNPNQFEGWPANEVDSAHADYETVLDVEAERPLWKRIAEDHLQFYSPRSLTCL